MKKVFLPFFLVLLLPLSAAAPAWAQEEPAQKDGAAPKRRAAPARGPGAEAKFTVNLAWQIALDEAHFSPGILDGTFGRKGLMAAAAYAAAHAPDADPHTAAGVARIAEALHVDVDHATTPYTLGAADLAEVGPALPEDWNERAKLDRLRYESLLEALAEKFHCTKALLTRLNPGMSFDTLQAGAAITAPNLRPFPASGPLHAQKGAPAAAWLSINLAEKTIGAFNASGVPIALFHCSVAKDKAKLPARDTVIKSMAAPPNYTFDPKNWPEVTNVDHVLTIASGPRNPVGLAWMGLDLPGYGMHGNPKPELIGKTGSHGCFRMTNWDALALFAMVKPGLKVKIVNPEKQAPEPAETERVH